DGNFHAGDVIDVLNPNGEPIARGESAFSSHDIQQIAGKSATEIEAIFPDRKRFEAIHRDALVLL
ncbi:MAG: glutamate 5-kinase, partial [Opitutales bacterium]|nr:glutamate 5-kinase [Opitutales bacterium]